MNKFFIGRAYGVREKRETIVPKALEDKEFMFNKTRVATDKAEKGNMKMKDFSKGFDRFKSKEKKHNFKLPNRSTNINFKSNSSNHSNKANNMLKNMYDNKDNKVSLNKMKTKSDMFLNTKYNKKVANPLMNEKLNMYSIGKIDYKKKDLSKFSSKISGASGKKYKLPIKDFSSKNQQYTLAPKSNEVGNIDYNKTTAASSDYDRMDNAKTITPEMLNTKINRPVQSEQPTHIDTKPAEASSTDFGLFSMDNREGSESLLNKGKSGLDYMTGKAKAMYNSSDFAKNRELNKEYADLRLQAKESLIDDPSTKADIFSRMQQDERARALRARKSDSTLGRFASGAGQFKAAINTVLPNVTTDRFKELSGFKIGQGHSYMAQSQVAGPGFRYSVAAGRMKKPGALKIAEMTSGVTKRPVPQYGMEQEQQMMLPPEPERKMVSNIQGPSQQASFKDIQKQYLQALIKRRMESGRELGAKGTAKLMNDIDRLNNPEPTPERKPQQVHYTPEQANNSRGYKNRKNHPDFGKKVMVNGEEKVISAYGKPVDFLRGSYNKLDTSNVNVTPVEQLN